VRFPQLFLCVHRCPRIRIRIDGWVPSGLFPSFSRRPPSLSFIFSTSFQGSFLFFLSAPDDCALAVTPSSEPPPGFFFPHGTCFSPRTLPLFVFLPAAFKQSIPSRAGICVLFSGCNPFFSSPAARDLSSLRPCVVFPLFFLPASGFLFDQKVYLEGPFFFPTATSAVLEGLNAPSLPTLSSFPSRWAEELYLGLRPLFAFFSWRSLFPFLDVHLFLFLFVVFDLFLFPPPYLLLPFRRSPRTGSLDGHLHHFPWTPPP